MGSLNKRKCEYSFFCVRVHLPEKLLGPWIFAVGATWQERQVRAKFSMPFGIMLRL